MKVFKNLNIIIFINVLVYCIFILIANNNIINGYKILYYLSVHSDIKDVIKMPYSLLTYGIFHFRYDHIFSNILTLLLYYPILSNIENFKLLKIYISSVFFGAIFWLIYLNFFNCIEDSILIGASGGIMGLISYSCNKWSRYLIWDFKLFKIYLIHLFYLHITITIIHFLDGYNLGGEIVHLTGYLVGWIFYKHEYNKTI